MRLKIEVDTENIKVDGWVDSEEWRKLSLVIRNKMISNFRRKELLRISKLCKPIRTENIIFDTIYGPLVFFARFENAVRPIGDQKPFSATIVGCATGSLKNKLSSLEHRIKNPSELAGNTRYKVLAFVRTSEYDVLRKAICDCLQYAAIWQSEFIMNDAIDKFLTAWEHGVLEDFIR